MRPRTQRPPEQAGCERRADARCSRPIERWSIGTSSVNMLRRHFLAAVLVTEAAVVLAVVWLLHVPHLGHWLQVHLGIIDEAGPYYGFWSGFGRIWRSSASWARSARRCINRSGSSTVTSRGAGGSGTIPPRAANSCCVTGITLIITGARRALI